MCVVYVSLYVCGICVCVYTWSCRCLQRPEEDLGFSGRDAMGAFTPPPVNNGT